MSEIKFLKGEYANYKGIASKDENAFYVTNELASVGNGADGQPIMEQVYALWLGTHLIASGNTAAMLVEETKNRVAMDSNLDKRLVALESGDNSVEKQIEKAIADLKAEIEGELGENDAKTLEAINDELDAIDEKIETLNGNATTNGSVAKAVADAKAELLGDAAAGYNTLGKLEDQIQAVAAAAKSYQIEAITGDLATNVKEAFKLVDEDGVQAGATINIYKDSSLEKVELDGQVLKFTYILNDGSRDTVNVDVSNFLAEAEFADGLIVTDHIVSVDVASASKENTDALVASGKNFLELEADGENHKALAVRSIDTDSTILQKDIVVAGMTTQFGAGNYENNDVIPAGTDIYTILQNILCKELYASPTSTTGTISASIGKPSISLDQTGTLEVGTLITMNSATVGNSTVSTKESKVEGMEYGYSAADDDTQDSTAKTITKSWTTAASGKDYKMSASLTGFTSDTVTNKQTVPTTVNAQAMSKTVLGCVSEGTNKIQVNVTGDTFTGSVDGIDSVYHCSNLGNTDVSKKTTAISAITNKESTAPTNNNSVTITGVYKYFMGSSTAQTVSDLDSAKVRALSVSGTITTNGTTTIKDDKAIWESNGNSIVIACPSKYKLETVTDSMGNDYVPLFSEIGDVPVATGSINTTYKVYIYPITSGTVMKLKNITLKVA